MKEAKTRRPATHKLRVAECRANMIKKVAPEIARTSFSESDLSD